MADVICHFCGKRIEQPHTYPKFDNGTVYGCQLVHNCSSGVRIQVVSSKNYKSKERALIDRVERIWYAYISRN